MSQAKKPSHHVVIYDKNDYAHRVGVCWPLKNAKGLSVVISPGVSIASIEGCRLVILPAKDKDESKSDEQRRKQERDAKEAAARSYDDDDIPF